MPHYCAFGCKETGVVLHVFPNPNKFPERFKTWVTLVGGKLETPLDYQFYKKKRVCDIHFTDEHKNRNKRLNILAIPSLFLPGQSMTQQSSQDITKVSQPLSACIAVTSEQSITQQWGANNDDITTTACPVTATPGQSMTRQSSQDITKVSQPLSACIAVTSEQSITQQWGANNDDITTTACPVTATPDGCNGVTTSAAVLVEHNYSTLSRLRRKSVLCTSKRIFQKNIRSLRTQICRLRKKGQSFKAQLANAEKLMKNEVFQLTTKNKNLDWSTPINTSRLLRYITQLSE